MLILYITYSKGFLIEFIAAPVIAGFTTAAALTIGTTQVKSLLGLKFEADGFVETWKAVFEHIEETKTWDAVMGFSSVAALLLLRVRPIQFFSINKYQQCCWGLRDLCIVEK